MHIIGLLSIILIMVFIILLVKFWEIWAVILMVLAFIAIIIGILSYFFNKASKEDGLIANSTIMVGICFAIMAIGVGGSFIMEFIENNF